MSEVTLNKEKLLFIINPVSGKKAGHKQEQAIIDLFSRSYDVSVQYTKQKGEGTALAKEFGSEADVVAVFGGDGTLNEVIIGVLSLANQPSLICLPGGTTNLLADTLHIPTKYPLLAAEGAIKAPPQPYDMARMNDEYFACVVSFGAFADSSYNTPQKLKNVLGYGAYVVGGARSLFKIRSYPIHIEADEGEYSGNYIFGAISNCAAVGGIVKFQPDTVIVDDGLYEVVLVKTPKTPAALFKALSCIRKREYDSRYVEFFQTKHLKLHCDKPLAWTIDGEYRGDMPDVTIDVLPGAIQIKY